MRLISFDWVEYNGATYICNTYLDLMSGIKYRKIYKKIN